jgi:hypothetical protein
MHDQVARTRLEERGKLCNLTDECDLLARSWSRHVERHLGGKEMRKGKPRSRHRRRAIESKGRGYWVTEKWSAKKGEIGRWRVAAAG